MDPAAAGHFTTFQVRDGRARGRELHLDRIVDASRALYGSAPAKDAVLAAIRGALVSAGPRVRECTVRVRVHPPRAGCRSDPVGREDHHPVLKIEVDIEEPRYPPAAPLRVRTLVGLRERAGIKHLALGFQQEARRAARQAGWDDALLVAPDGRISEGSFWNIVFWDGSVAVWPDAPALPGVTRQLLAGALEGARIAQRREPVTAASLDAMRAAFALNSTGIADIAEIERHRFPGDPKAGTCLRRLLADIPWDII